MSAAWVWVKKYWEYLAATALLFLGVFLGVQLKKRPVVVAGESPEQKELEEKTSEEEAEILNGIYPAQQEIRTKQEEGLQGLVEAEKKQAAELVKDPDATNDYLKQVGRSVRGDDNGGSQ